MSYQPPSILPQLAAAPTIVTPSFPTVIGAPTPIDDPMSGAGAPAKMFVGGLPQSVTQDSLREYFGRFGRISEAFVLMDDASGRSRGFGFVTFENPGSLQRVLHSRPHYLDGKCVDCKHAVLKGQGGGNAPRQDTPSTGPLSNPNNANNIPISSSSQSIAPATTVMNTGTWSRTFKPARSENNNPPPPMSLNASSSASSGSANGSASTMDSSREVGDEDDELFLTGGGKSYLALSGDKWLEDCAEADERKIFVGGLPDVTPAEFASFFEHFGPVADAMVMFDRKRRRQRGFGFITFATGEGVTNALQFNRHPVKGKLAEVKKAHPLVLQKARAPAKKEREQAQQQQALMDKRLSPSGTGGASNNSGKRKNSVSAAGATWSGIATSSTSKREAQSGMAAGSADYSTWTGAQKARNDMEDGLVDPFATMGEPSMGAHHQQQQHHHGHHVGHGHGHQQPQQQDEYKSRFPSAPWNEDLDKRRYGYEEESRMATNEIRPQFIPSGEYSPFYGAPHTTAEMQQQQQYGGPPQYGGYPLPHHAPQYHHPQPVDPYTTAMMGGAVPKCYSQEVAGYGPGAGYEAPSIFNKR